MRIFLAAVLAAFAFIVQPAAAVKPVFDLNVFYLTDTFAYGDTTSAYKRTFFDLMAGFGITKKKSLVLGWNYASMTFGDKPDDTETTLKISDMGPKLMYYFDKDRTWVIALTYNLITKGDYNNGTATTELRGNSLRGEFGYLPMMWENVYMGAKLVYYKGTFKEEITNTTSLEQVSYSRTVIYPVFSMTFRWE